MLYISDNRISPKVFEKLQQTCKYFFARNPVLIVDIFFFYFSFYTENDIFLPNILYSLKRKYWKPENDIPSDLAIAWFKLKELPKNILFWMINELEYNGRKETSEIPLLLPKIYQISLKTLKISQTNLSKSEFDSLIIAENLEVLSLYSVTITDYKNDDKKITWFEIYEKLPFLRIFIYENMYEITSVKTVMKLHTIDHKVKLKNFYLDLIISSPLTDIIYLWEFMKYNISTEWMKKQHCWEFYPDFKFIFRNKNFETNYFRHGEPSFEFLIKLAVPDPKNIPQYDEKEFFENGIIKQLD